ncbi:MAG: hypothetical protein HXY40_11185 [Chloroflexi bacterium]|nr:hypothetical protein [Chloroflexota bacterium]
MNDNWLQHTLRRSGWRPQRQITWLLGVGVLIAIVMGALYLSQVAGFASTNRELEQLIAERDELERINEQLRAEIASFQSVPRLLARAQELGFSPAPPDRIEYLLVEGYDANRAATVAPLDDAQDALPTYDETFWGWLQQQWDLLRQQFDSFTNPEGQ